MRHFISPEAVSETIKTIALHAGQEIMAVYEQMDHGIQTKPDQSPLTLADTRAHTCIVQGLSGAFPDIPVVSEEDEGSWLHRHASSAFWLVDPLDGTKEFISRSGDFTVNIAYVDQGVARFGVVYAPALNTLYWGGPGWGAWREEATGQVTVLTVQAEPDTGTIDSPKCSKPLRVVASKSHLNDETRAFIDKLGHVELVQAGSSLKFCRIAENQADVYPRLAPTCEWDTAAAQAVLEGAGGVVLDTQGQRVCYGKPDILNVHFIAARNRMCAGFDA